jgi:hypothetical protein
MNNSHVARLADFVEASRPNVLTVLYVLSFNARFARVTVLKQYEVRVQRGTRWRSWLAHCATSQKVAGSITDGDLRADSASKSNEYQAGT